MHLVGFFSIRILFYSVCTFLAFNLRLLWNCRLRIEFHVKVYKYNTCKIKPGPFTKQQFLFLLKQNNTNLLSVTKVFEVLRGMLVSPYA